MFIEVGIQGQHNVPHSAWVEADVTFTVLLAALILTHVLRGTYRTQYPPLRCPPLKGDNPNPPNSTCDSYVNNTAS
jgi:hypothetical protein